VSGPIRVGIHYETWDPLPTQRAVWKAADAAGFDSIWNSDHLARLPSGGGPHGPILDGWTALAAMAEATQRIRIGVLVTANLHRHPSLLAKMATTVDHISGGRLEVGMGTAWNEAACSMLGMPFADRGERGRRLGEACAVLKALWTEEKASYAGRYYQLKDAVSDPKPLQKPHPPIMIGGRGPRVTLRVAARYGDAWNTSGSRGIETDLEAARLLDEHCAVVGRDPASIRKTVILEWTSASDALGLAEQYAEAGFTEFYIPVSSEDPLRELDGLARDALEPLRALASSPGALARGR
jgi:F420-dependent oxidoreductase-like protein